MSRYIFFKELKEKYPLVEIFEFLQAGLQPLRDPSLTPIPCPKEHHQYTMNNYGIKFVRDRFGHDSDTIAQFIKRNKESEAEDPSLESWKYFVPPDEESENNEVEFDNPSLNSLAKLLPPTRREPENIELKNVISILQNAIFEEKQLIEILEKQKNSSPLNKIKPKKLRPDQRHRLECRKVAEKLWEKDKHITIQDMIFLDEINTIYEGKSYGEKIIRNWIKDLCPNRKPGRRPKK